MLMRWSRWIFLGAGMALAVPHGSASAAELRFSTTAAGNIVATGNTLGLSKGVDVNAPGEEDGIGTFISLDANSVDGTYPAGTTSDWMENGSEAQLTLGPDAEVLYAELVWGGGYAFGAEDVSDDIDADITLAYGNDSISVTFDDDTDMTLFGLSSSGTFQVNYYMRSADVTEFVAEHLGGTYAASGIPATADDNVEELQAAGWTLIVAYRDSNEPVRNLTVFVGGSFVDEFTTEDYAFDGFCTPAQGEFEGYAAVSTIEGDADRDGDSLAIAETALDAFVPLSAPNNPVDNFFASQINDGDGMLDTSGSFGNANHALGTNVSGGRQGWDITRVPLSSAASQLANGQTTAVLRTQTSDDSYFPTTVAFSIGINAPDFTGDGTGHDFTPDAIAIDETSTITIDMENTGLVDATGLEFFSPLPQGLTLDNFTIDGVPGDINGGLVDDAALSTGVALGDVAVGVSRQIVMVVRADGAPVSGDSWTLSPTWNYDYVSCAGEPPLTEPFLVSDIVIDYVEPSGTTTGDGGTTGGDDSDSDSDTDVDPSSASDAASITDTASDSDSDSGDTDSDSDTAGVAESEDGCGCRSRGRGGDPPLSLLVLLALAAGRRRRHAARS